MATWDPINGVWEGGEIPNTNNLISPLYIFGYGSLLWRPGDLLGKYPSYACKCFGWRRKFAQRSMDHRGNPEFPGMVATLIEDYEAQQSEEVDSPSSLRTKHQQSECLGLIFHVPEEESDELIKELDWRERGGYNRHVISIELLANTAVHCSGEIVSAIVYTGTTDNPNFFDPIPISDRLPVAAGASVPMLSGDLCHPSRLWGRDAVADIISVGRGPSGRNIDYLFQLTSYFKLQMQKEQLGGSGTVGGPLQTDFYLIALETKVRMRMGVWRGFCLPPSPQPLLDGDRGGESEITDEFDVRASFDTFPTAPVASAAGSGNEVCVVGFGSNEAGQVLGHVGGTEGGVSLIYAAVRVNLVASILRRANSAGAHSRGDNTAATRGGALHALYYYDPLFHEQPRRERDTDAHVRIISVYAGSSHSGVLLSNHDLYVWGKVSPNDAGGAIPVSRLTGIVGASFGFDTVLALHKSGVILSCTAGVSSAAVPELVKPVQLPSPSGCTAEDLVHAGELIYSSGGERPRLVVSQTASGLKHCVAAGADGEECVLVSWGDNRHGQCPTAVDVETGAEVVSSPSEAPVSVRLPSLRPENLSSSAYPYALSATTSVHSVACGARHTIILDSNNNVWSCGDNRYGSLGRDVRLPATNDEAGGRGMVDSVLRRVTKNLPLATYWQRVCSGWSHVALRGYRSTPSDFCEVVCLGWGRADMGQLGAAPEQLAAIAELTADGKGVRYPTPLPVLTGAEGTAAVIGEVWCGAEHTVVCDNASGLLYSSGWNDHGTLGQGGEGPGDAVLPQNVYQWSPVVVRRSGGDSSAPTSHAALPSLYEGFLATGGAHCLAVVASDCC